MKDFPVDIVYTWVDGSDKQWLSKKNKVLDKYNHFHKSSEVSGKKRFINKDELKFSLRSIEKYCPWVRNIYLVTDNQVPKWLNINNKQIIIINHEDIFPSTKFLPTFNSNAIEMRLHHIQGLSNNFLSFNDDFFIGRPAIKEDFFYKDGTPKLYMGGRKSKIKLKLRFRYPSLRKLTAHASAIYNSRKLILDKYNILINRDLVHTVKALNKNILYDIENEFFEVFRQTLKNQFRDLSDTWIISLHAYYLISKGLNTFLSIKKINKRDYVNRLYLLLKIKLDYAYIALNSPIEQLEHELLCIRRYKPLSFCLNDWPDNNEYADKIIMNFLTDLFPEKSCYEK
ncbi:MAG: hypothetical protein CMG66_04725 [Candidatus Marinimicrobia bacterium]|nr:hypothetical protein [Candidatus Neomarinimicrobiota bacterium]|tara:strand:+ start:3891 stop:4913 length:1023 start_codon:yes stop_codon:yes gene_type:complete